MAPLNVNISTCRYQAMIGVGGIGTGVFFALNGNHTLGREESRSGRFLDRRDYCKLHIISHYVKVLLGPEFATVPVGKVGGDDAGRRLFEEMRDVGLDMRYVELCPGEQTLMSICLLYPDGTGGNLTVDDSACNQVDVAFLAVVEPEFARFEGRGIALAAPEVPMAARERLLQLGTLYRFLRVASFISSEMPAAVESGVLGSVDLVGINVDEAAAVGGVSAEGQSLASIVEAAIERLGDINPLMFVSVTAGKSGSWSWDGTTLAHVPALPAEVVNTAGAGDAHLSGLVAGLVAGLTLAQAQELGTLVAALSVTSPHTIASEIERRSLQAFAARLQAPLSDAVWDLLNDA
jgi:ribokinase